MPFQVPTTSQNLANMAVPSRPSKFVSANEAAAFDYISANTSIFDAIESCANPEIVPPLPKPMRGDWLACQTETGQSFRGYTRGNPPTVAAMYSKSGAERIALCALGTGISDSMLSRLVKYVEAFYGITVTVMQAPIEAALANGTVRSRIHPETGKRQLWACDAQAFVKQSVESRRFLPLCTMGITMEDLTKDENWNFIYGLASLSDWMGVFSLHRFSPEFNHEPVASEAEADAIILRRACKVVCHELGHIFGLKHCINHHCLMNEANHLGELNRQRMVECPCCTKKLSYTFRWDLAARYTAIRNASAELGFDDVVSWVDQHMAPLLATLSAISIPEVPVRTVTKQSVSVSKQLPQRSR
jgi:archaemetzincin